MPMRSKQINKLINELWGTRAPVRTMTKGQFTVYIHDALLRASLQQIADIRDALPLTTHLQQVADRTVQVVDKM